MKTKIMIFMMIIFMLTWCFIIATSRILAKAIKAIVSYMLLKIKREIYQFHQL